MPYKLGKLLLLGFALCGALGLTECWAQSSAPAKSSPAGPIPAGEYRTELGWGQLSISPAVNGAPTFSLHTATGEDICDIQGRLVNNEGQATDNETGQVCRIAFTPQPRGLDVKPITPDSCRGFCGANGGFKGFYVALMPACQANAIEATRKAFKRLYEDKAYPAALAKLKPVLDQCGTTLDFVELGDIRNDVAITQYRNNRSNDCLKTLVPYAADAKRDDKDIVADWPLTEGDDYLKIVHAARTNIRLCSKATGK